MQISQSLVNLALAHVYFPLPIAADANWNLNDVCFEIVEIQKVGYG